MPGCGAVWGAVAVCSAGRVSLSNRCGRPPVSNTSPTSRRLRRADGAAAMPPAPRSDALRRRGCVFAAWDGAANKVRSAGQGERQPRECGDDLAMRRQDSRPLMHLGLRAQAVARRPAPSGATTRSAAVRAAGSFAVSPNRALGPSRLVCRQSPLARDCPGDLAVSADGRFVSAPGFQRCVQQRRNGSGLLDPVIPSDLAFMPLR